MADRNVEVIYVCPVHLGEDLIHYYSHLLGPNGAVEPGTRTPCAKRFTILTPEAHQHFSVWVTACTHTQNHPLHSQLSEVQKRSVKYFTCIKGIQSKNRVWQFRFEPVGGVCEASCFCVVLRTLMPPSQLYTLGDERFVFLIFICADCFT